MSLLILPRHKPILTISADIIDLKTGRLLDRLEPRPANTFTQQWIQMLYVSFAQATLTTAVKDVVGSSKTVSTSASLMALNAGSGTYTYGIVIGTGAPGTPGYVDNKLTTQYTTTTNFTHGAMTINPPSVSGSEYQLVLQRQFSNNTGSLVSITEAGIYANYAAGTAYFCLDHTAITISLGSGTATTLSYTCQTP
jgi:hypothetical protein